MAKYKPATGNDSAVLRRREERMAAAVASASAPSGTRTFQATEKIGEVAQKVAELEKAVIPVGGTVLMAKDESPAASGYPGAWERLTAFHVPMTGKTLYIYERKS